MAKLSEIFTLQMGKTPARANKDYWNGGSNSWVSISDLSTYEKYVSDTSEAITDLAVKESGIKPVPANTVIMSFKLSIGKTAITTEPVYTNEAIMAFIPNGKYEVYPDYLYHMFSGRDWSKGTNRAVMGSTLNKATLSDMEIQLPPIESQKQIAERLDKVDEIITKRKQQLSKLDELVKSRFIEMFGDPITNSKKLPMERMELRFNLKAGITTAADDIHDFKKNTYEVPCYGGNGIRGYVKNKSYVGNYPIIGRQGALCGNVQYATGEFHATEHAVLVSLLKNDNTIWVFYLLNLMDLYRYHTGAAQPGLAVKKLNTVDIIVADIEFQDKFATFVKQTDKLKLEIKESLEKIETLKKSLMQKYFG